MLFLPWVFKEALTIDVVALDVGDVVIVMLWNHCNAYDLYSNTKQLSFSLFNGGKMLYSNFIYLKTPTSIPLSLAIDGALTILIPSSVAFNRPYITAVERSVPVCFKFSPDTTKSTFLIGSFDNECSRTPNFSAISTQHLHSGFPIFAKAGALT